MYLAVVLPKFGTLNSAMLASRRGSEANSR
jgi:hypothetical protein